MRILAKWRPDCDWTLEPGDMLYVPPHCGHEGVALDAGQTLSVGFLAPSHDTLLTAFVQDATTQLDATQRYQDPALQARLSCPSVAPCYLLSPVPLPLSVYDCLFPASKVLSDPNLGKYPAPRLASSCSLTGSELAP